MSGVGWKALSQVLSQGSRTIVGILLAHLLTPNAFGLAAMALVFTGFAAIFTDLSLGSALVQRATITEEDRSTVFWTTVGSGLAMTAIGIALAPVAGIFFSRPEVVPLFAACAALTFFSAISSTQMALLTREMNFRSLEIREIVSTLVAAAAAVTMALAGFGAWAIVGQALVGASVSTVLVWRLSHWRPRRTYSRRSLVQLGSFGVKTLFSRILGYLNLNVDNLLIGRYLGSNALGVYSIAYNVMFMPMSRVVSPIQDVMFPALVQLQDDPPRLAQTWLRGNRLAAAIAVPAFLGIAIVAPDFVPVVLGARWHRSVPVLQLLSLAGVAQSLQTLNWSAIQAKGKPGLMLRIMVFTSVVTLTSFAVGLRWGVVGVAGLFAAARFIALLVNTTATCRILDVSLKTYVRSTATLLALTVAMAAAVYVARLALVHAGLAAPLRLPLLVVLGGAVYALLVAWRARDLVGEVRLLIGRG